MLAGKERQLVVLDDALVFTDTYRHKKMSNVISQAAEDLQIIILTSQRERFKGLKGKKLNLEELRS